MGSWPTHPSASARRGAWSDEGGAFRRRLPGPGADGEDAVRTADVVQLLHRVDVDQVGRARQAEVHERDEALAPREHAAAVLKLAEEARRLLDRPGGVIRKGRRFHRDTAPSLVELVTPSRGACAPPPLSPARPGRGRAWREGFRPPGGGRRPDAGGR